MHYQLSAENHKKVARIFEKLEAKLKVECSRLHGIIPYIPKGGHYHDLDTGDGIYWWTNGFWPGILWQLYHATNNETYRKSAEAVEKRLDQALEDFEGLNHDIGFMWLHTAAANYRLTGNGDSRRRALHAANLLAGRYNPVGKFIRAWNEDRIGWIIIDTMMNLPLLYWASEETADPRFALIARAHAETAMRALMRPDGSCNHIAVLSPVTGENFETPGGQGYGSGSSWSRGQAWALYGFALSFRHIGERSFLDTAKRAAHYVIANLALNNWLAPVDFRAPATPVTLDSTATVIAACGFLEIAAHVGEYERALYAETALKLLLASEAAFADWDNDRDGIIGKGTTAYHDDPDGTEVPIIYGDYFFVEAVLRFLEKDFLLW
ncbi:MAG: glycoside hydrolase family 88 protein [Treponema sp.]|jgi:unsaturated chondroitin disaccharide hydrolase|nr:glycoside hydrolase family 88 protein [Treponema sp.]